MFENIKLNYLYRDGGNYKQFGSVTFLNKSGISPEKATELLLEKLISSEFFVAEDWKLTRLHKFPYDPEIDHNYHQFESFEFTQDQFDDEREIAYFLNIIEKGI